MSKAWKAFLRRRPHLWTELVFDGGRKPSEAWFKALGKFTNGNVESLAMREIGPKTIGPRRMLAIFQAMPRLKYLKMRLQNAGPLSMLFDAGLVWSGLTSLTLSHDEKGHFFAMKVLLPLLERNQDSLEDLSVGSVEETFFLLIGDCGEPGGSNFCFPLSRLRTLHIDLPRTGVATTGTLVRTWNYCPRINQS